MSKILVVEDERLVRQMLVRALETRGHEVRAVADGIGALQTLKRSPFDLIISDIIMPEMDGIALALQVSKEHPKTRIVLMTGYTQESKRARNLDALVHGVLTKPFELDEMWNAVDSALEGAKPQTAKTPTAAS